jgi:hypothetical protein
MLSGQRDFDGGAVTIAAKVPQTTPSVSTRISFHSIAPRKATVSAYSIPNPKAIQPRKRTIRIGVEREVLEVM